MSLGEIIGLEQWFVGLYLAIHGLIHLIFLFNFFDEKENSNVGWSGKSWLLDRFIQPKLTSYIGKIVWISIAILFVICGLSVLDILLIDELLTPLIIISSIIATLAFVIFYDGLAPTAYHWILGVIINLVLIAFIFIFPNEVIVMISILILIVVWALLFHSRVMSLVTNS